MILFNFTEAYLLKLTEAPYFFAFSVMNENKAHSRFDHFMQISLIRFNLNL